MNNPEMTLSPTARPLSFARPKWPGLASLCRHLSVLLALTMSLAVQAGVTVDQDPLIVSKPLAPNVVLMLDDSGSMAWDYMPDGLDGTYNKNNKAWQTASINNVYYDPEITYEPPVRADGGQYPDIVSFPNAPLNGYDESSSLIKIPSWRSPWAPGTFNGGFPYGIDVKGSCYSRTQRSGWESKLCYRSNYPVSGLENQFVYNRNSGSTYYYADDGPSAFIYNKPNGQVVGVSTSCANSEIQAGTSQCFSPDDTSGSAAPAGVVAGENIANWFSYYRTRMLSAKAGVMNAFSDLDPAFRVGFGSINGGTYGSNDNDDHLPSEKFDGSYAYISEVLPFGDINLPGNTSRAGLFSWLKKVRANSSYYNGSSFGGTPLRRSLVAAGEYYKTDQPWEVGYDEGGSYDDSQYSCRQSYTLLMSDGYWNRSSPGVGNSDNSDGDEIVSADGQDKYEYSPRKPFSDEKSNRLADVAMKYWKQDLRSEMVNNVPVTGNDPAFWQHMTTFTIGLGLEPDIANKGGGSMTDIFSWARTGEPGSIDKDSFKWGSDKIADLAHAAVNGHGDFFSASDPQSFAQGMRDALASIDNATGAGDSATLSGGEEVKEGTLVYTGTYTTGEWSGALKARKYSESSGNFDAEVWNAGGKFPQAADRNIWTHDASGAAVLFKSGSLSGSQSSALEDNIDTGFNVPAADIVAYLRGERSYEDSEETPLSSGKTLRKRASLLGDIVTSTPVHVGPPASKYDAFNFADQGFAGLDKYEAFANEYKDRDALLYVAANDGMLHAFDAETGVEKFAFIPGALLSATGDASLARLANPRYGLFSQVDGTQPVPHQYYNDGEMATQNVYLDDEWKTILVGTTGRGPTRTIYAIDITNPEVLSDPDQAESAVLWERSAGDGKSNADWIGQSLARPTLWQVKDESSSKWVVVVGNGPNSPKDRSALLQFDLADGNLKVYDAGTQSSNGLAAPTGVSTDPGEGVADYAFAGDLQGNVWQFDLAADGGSGKLLFKARGPSGQKQAISARMNATKNPDDGSIWVFFGTGKYLSEGDIDDTSVQSWYGLRAQAKNSGKEVSDGTTGRADLVKRNIVKEESVGGVMARATSAGNRGELDADGKVGWYMDLVSPKNGEEGERILYVTQLVGGYLSVNTTIPKAENPCDTLPAGASLIVDPFSGANPGRPFMDADSDGNFDSIDDLPVNGVVSRVGASGASTFGKDTKGNVIGISPDLGGNISKVPSLDFGSAAAEQLNWHELISH